MYCICSDSGDPCFNLAADEYLLTDTSEEFLVLGINSNCAVIGKHQSAHRETDTRFVYENHIPVVRRISGGGTVFHDTGDLNYSLILNSEEGKQVNFRKYTEPVIRFLSSVGINALFEGKNDIRVNGLKVSGNSEHVYHNRVLHHGTLLFDTDMNLLKGSIRNDTSAYRTKAVSSNPSHVINLKVVLKDHLKDHLKDLLTTDDFRSLMMRWFLENVKDTESMIITDEMKEKIETLAGKRYRTWEWNYAYGPEYQLEKKFVFGGEECSCRLLVKDGIIHECDMSGTAGLKAAGKDSIGCRHMADDLTGIFQRTGLTDEGFDIFNLF